MERLWDRNLGQQFLFWMCGRRWAISAGIWGTRQSENTNIAGPVALAQVNHFGSRSFNKLVGRCLHMYTILKRTHTVCTYNLQMLCLFTSVYTCIPGINRNELQLLGEAKTHLQEAVVNQIVVVSMTSSGQPKMG